MAQQHLKFNNYTPPDVDEDGYKPAEAVTSVATRGRTMRGSMKGGVLFTVEAYNLKWSNISAKDVSRIKKEVLGKESFMFNHFNTYSGQWENKAFMCNNVNTDFYSLVEGQEMCNELSFQVTAIEPLNIGG